MVFVCMCCVFFFKQKTAYEMRISDWSSDVCSSDLEARLERELAAVLGSASARLLLDAARRQAGPDLDTVAAIVGEASQDLRFNTRVHEGALENMSQGISVVDAPLLLVAWNRRYAEMFDLQQELLRICSPIADLSRRARSRLARGEIERAPCGERGCQN